MGLINNINNETSILWQIITKFSISIMLDANAKVENNIFIALNYI